MGYTGTMKIALIENIRYLCENIQETQNQGRRAEEIIDRWTNGEGMAEIGNLYQKNS
jgi:cyclic beta-1,2-glucan synthetase